MTASPASPMPRVGGNVLRTYVYDTNPDNPSHSQNSTGRLTEIKYPAITYVDSNNSLSDTNQFTDMFSYTAPGAVAGKLLQVNKTHTYNNNFQPQKAMLSTMPTFSPTPLGTAGSLTEECEDV